MDILKSFEVAKNIYFASSDEKILRTLETIFPQLKEQTDERIRKAIIEFFELQDDNTTYSFISKKDILDWLYRQGSNQYNKCEYHKGDWLYDEVNKIFCVIKKERDNTYRLVDINGEEYDVPKYTLSYQYHRFTLNDVKDGDILVNGSNIFIFKYIYDTRVMGYCHVNIDNRKFYDDNGKNDCFGLTDSVFTPATNEQCNYLFTKIDEFGYKWDADKKQLIDKINPKFKIGDWIISKYEVPCYVKNIYERQYELCSTTGYNFTKYIKDVDNGDYDIWTIDDAKDGDILCVDNTLIFIYKKSNDNNIDVHCYYHIEDDVIIIQKDLICISVQGNIYPATKEQHNMLHKKLQEFGLTWNATKKTFYNK